ncbi:hypothetical protein NLX71_26015 [Paenibacillus sp. MZ04-78.2]|uniref:hypothetical protein n=1 Tax=Paenibacillus sp. MZ04-78.2 TaxID=2962034 RepID=UPI0020B7E962|nr:hypothetical protein [Paenibacillus sp. MZ04-78.2]MCP3776699.1 hypothetical protein [Paenibacillus sp. MZ04-78.2]
MKQNNEKEVKNENHEIPSFNSVTEHYRSIMGVPTNKVDMKKMPRVLRLFGYFVFAIAAICSIIFIVMYILQFL